MYFHMYICPPNQRERERERETERERQRQRQREREMRQREGGKKRHTKNTTVHTCTSYIH